MSKSPSHMLGRPIVLVVVAAAVLLGTFAGVGYAATSHAAATNPAAGSATGTKATVSTKLVFHKLKLENGWESAGPLWQTGSPEYAISAEGIVYLAGSLYGGKSGLSTPAFQMPVAARPASDDCFPIFTNSTVTKLQQVGVIHIAPNGQATLVGSTVTSFSSLVGISYPVGV